MVYRFGRFSDAEIIHPRPIVARQQVGAPHEYEPDYDAYWRDLESLEQGMADVASYDDWFVEEE